MKPALVVVGPVPPPVHGVAVSTALVLASAPLRARFEVTHLDTSDRRALDAMGAWDARNVRLALLHVARLDRALRRLRPGLVYLPISQGAGGFLRDALFIRDAVRRGWRVAVHLRGGEFRRFVRGLPAPMRGLVRSTLRRVHGAAVMGASLRDELSGFVAPEAIAVVPNGTPDEWAEASAGGRDPVVLFVGHLRARKGVEPAFEAARIVTRSDPNARVRFVGDWRDEALRRRIAARLPGEDRIEFRPGATGEERARLLASAAVFLFPPIEPEGHPRVVIEALAAGLPVVTTDRGAIRESVRDGVEGYVLPEPDPRVLAERILGLLGDEEHRRRMGTAARARYLAEFTQDRADAVLADWLGRVAR